MRQWTCPSGGAGRRESGAVAGRPPVPGRADAGLPALCGPAGRSGHAQAGGARAGRLREGERRGERRWRGEMGGGPSSLGVGGPSPACPPCGPASRSSRAARLPGVFTTDPAKGVRPASRVVRQARQRCTSKASVAALHSALQRTLLRAHQMLRALRNRAACVCGAERVEAGHTHRRCCLSQSHKTGQRRVPSAAARPRSTASSVERPSVDSVRRFK